TATATASASASAASASTSTAAKANTEATALHRSATAPDQGIAVTEAEAHPEHDTTVVQRFSLARLLSYCWRESLELRRDPIRATLALAGSLILMVVIGFGISLDVEELTYAVLDRDQTTVSHNYALNLSGSRYFTERPP